MSKIESYKPGSFCWAELATTDPGAAKQFYGDMFGWEAVDMPGPEGVYTIFRKDGEDVGACYQPRPEFPTHWGLYFSTPSADESAAKAESLGGKVLGPAFDVADLGRMAILQDPHGVTFSVWQAKSKIGATYAGPFGMMVWPELHTPDAEASLAFYQGLFAWTTKASETGVDSAQYVELVNAGQPMGGLMPMRGEEWKGVPPHWMVYVTVADADERAARIKQLGGNVCVGPLDIPNVGRFAVVNDPQGGTFSLIQLTHRMANA